MATQSKLPLAPAAESTVTVENQTFELEPIRGYPELRWAGKRPFRTTHYYPAQLKETHGAEVDGWRSELYWGDNLQVLSHLLKQYRAKVKLIYIDPPFDSKAEYKKTVRLRGKTAANDRSAFEEKQYTDIWANDEYLQFMYERLVLIRELLADDGSVYLHCDWHKSHHLRCILDEVFGPENFLNEIVWKRADTVKGNFGQGTKNFGSNTDTIFFYRKRDNTFKPIYTPYSQEYIDQFFRYKEPDGRVYRLVSMIGPGGETKGNPRYEVMGVTRYWRYSETKMRDLIDRGLVVQTSPGTVPQRKLYLDDGKGVAVQSLWDDITGLGAGSNERLDYPTQKPEKLLERIIEASSMPGDIVLDCFMGSGTAQAVAMRLGRRFIGCDINLGAVHTTVRRLLAVAAEIEGGLFKESLSERGAARCYCGFSVFNVNRYDVFRNPVQARELLIEALEIQPLNENSAYDGEKDGRMVKIMPVNRIATRQDLNELITNFDYRAFEQRKRAHPSKPVEKLLLVCMGHEPDLAAHLKKEVPYLLDVEVVDILRDKSHLEFKRDSTAKIVTKGGKLVIEAFYPMNLLQKLSLMKEDVGEWRELVDSVMIDFNYDGAVFQPSVVDIPEHEDRVVDGTYPIPKGAGTIRVKITDLLSESLEVDVRHG